MIDLTQREILDDLDFRRGTAAAGPGPTGWSDARRASLSSPWPVQPRHVSEHHGGRTDRVHKRLLQAAMAELATDPAAVVRATHTQ
jgi:cytochrome b